MIDETVKFLAELVNTDSTNPPANEDGVAQCVADYLRRNDVVVHRQVVAPGRSNLIASLTDGLTTQRPSLCFCGHLDTVPIGSAEWTHDPFGGEVAGGNLFGRGASDMKSGVAAMAVMMARLRKMPNSAGWPIQLLLTVGEEVDSVGAQEFLAQYGVSHIGGMVIGEPTNGDVVVGHKGAQWVEVECFGRTAHGSMPQLGINAIDQSLEAIRLLYQLRPELQAAADAVLGSSTATITQMGAGIQTNVIPDRAFFQVDMRFAKPEVQQRFMDHWQQALDEHMQTHPEFRYEWHQLLNRAPLMTPPTHPLIQKAQELLKLNPDSWRTVSYYTDGSVLAAPTKIPTLIYGPGDDKLAHQPDESVSIAAFSESIEFYRELAVSYGRGDWQLRKG